MCVWIRNGSGLFIGSGYRVVRNFVSFIMLIVIIGVVYFIFKDFKNNYAGKDKNVRIDNYDVLKISNEKSCKKEITKKEYLRKRKLVE
ncbi:hypothetical protein [Thermosipho globiformans]|uniref:hypothetical protein n=1 Tax=Thermosipho globiformans TaxID=380685 RepID=UPI0013DEF03C|nr:hypothetical protein [Thermosipho globiformans]